VPNRCTLVRFVSLSRGAGEGERAAPLAHFVGEEPGLRATKLLNPRKIPLNFPRIAPSPLDIRAKMCYTMDVIGATPEDPPLTNPTKMGYTMGTMESATLPLL